MTEIDKLKARIAELEKLAYVPGMWRCAKCGFVLHQMTLHTATGSITARDAPGEKCPNDGAPLWRVTERENGTELMQRLEEALAKENVLTS